MFKYGWRRQTLLPKPPRQPDATAVVSMHKVIWATSRELASIEHDAAVRAVALACAGVRHGHTRGFAQRQLRVEDVHQWLFRRPAGKGRPCRPAPTLFPARSRRWPHWLATPTPGQSKAAGLPPDFLPSCAICTQLLWLSPGLFRCQTGQSGNSDFSGDRALTAREWNRRRLDCGRSQAEPCFASRRGGEAKAGELGDGGRVERRLSFPDYAEKAELSRPSE